MRAVNSQPIILALSAVILVAVGLGSIGAWRFYTGTAPEQDRLTSARLLQARTAQVAEQLVEKTKNLERSQQETVEQVQAAAEQLVVLKRLLITQQAETKRLSEQVGGVAEAVDGLRQSFASAPSQDVSTAGAKRRSTPSSPRLSKPRLKKRKPKRM